MDSLTSPTKKSSLQLCCQDVELVTDFSHASFPAFYSSLFSEDVSVSGLDACYTKFSRPILSQDLSLVSYEILRLNFISQTLQALADDSSDEQQSKNEAINQDILDQVSATKNAFKFVINVDMNASRNT